MKNIWIFFPASLFKIIFIAVLSVFIRGWVVLFIVSTWVIMFITLYIIKSCYDLRARADEGQQAMECILLSWLTVAGLGRNKNAAVYRLVSTLLVTLLYTLILTIILTICNMDANTGYTYGAALSWKDLPIAQETFYLNLLLGATIALGWGAFVVDIIITWCKNHDWRLHNWGPLRKMVDWFVDPLPQEAGFWDEAVLLQGLGAKK